MRLPAIWTLLASCVVALSLAAGNGPAFAQVDRATAEALLRDSGLAKALGELRKDFQTDLGKALLGKSKDSRADIEQLERRVDAAFAPERLKQTAAAVLESDLDPAYVPALQAWFESPAGKSITKVEMNTPGDQEGIQKLRKTGAALLEQIPETRRVLLEDVLVASGAAQMASAIAIQTSLAMAGAIRRARPDANVPSEVQMRAQFESARPGLEREMSSSLLQMYAAIYREISDARLQEYEATLTSAAGRHLTKVLSKAAESALVAGTKQFWQDLLPAGKMRAS
jgi:hypothetical protein